MISMSFGPPPKAAAWQHCDARTGFEVVYFEPRGHGYQIEGCTTAIEDGQPWMVSYAIEVDANWATQHARIMGQSAAGTRHTVLEAARDGRWRVDGNVAPDLDGCLDVDLESSAMTNALPVHRMGLQLGVKASAPAAYVRAVGLGVERLEQEYLRIADENSHQRYAYSASAFQFTARLVYDASGLVLEYPGIAVRAG
jgi:uncharacterized protein